MMPACRQAKSLGIIDHLPAENQVVLPRPMQERKGDQVRRDGKSQLDHPAVSHDRSTIDEVDVNVVMLEEDLVERMNRLEHGLLGNKEQPSPIRVMTDIEPLPGRRNDVQQIRRQAFRRLDVYSDRPDIAAHPHRCNRDTGIVAERACYPCGPDGRSGGGSRQDAFGPPKPRQELARDNASGTARAPYLEDTRSKGGSLFRQ